MDTLKRCSKCLEELPATTEYFPRDKSHADGLFGQCKTCRNKSQRDRRAGDPARYAVYARRKYLKDPGAVKRRVLAWQHTPKGRKAKQDYRNNNLVQHQEQNRNHYKKNRQRFLDRTKRWQQDNPDKLRATAWRRAARRRNFPANFTLADWQFALDYFGGGCAVCGRPLNGIFHKAAADHWIPLASADCIGTVPANIVPLCQGQDGCNNRKVDRDAMEWLTFQFGARQAKKIMAKVQEFFSQVRQA